MKQLYIFKKSEKRDADFGLSARGFLGMIRRYSVFTAFASWEKITFDRAIPSV